MLSFVYFVIVARNDLKALLQGCDAETSELLTETRLWSSQYPDRSNWSLSSLAVKVKLLFLAHLRNEYSDCEEYQRALRGLSISEGTFDKWWSILPLELDEKSEEVAASLDPAVVNEIDRTCIYAVDQWIEGLRTHALKAE